MKKPKVKMLLKLTAAVLSVVMMLCALPLGAVASEVEVPSIPAKDGVTIQDVAAGAASVYDLYGEDYVLHIPDAAETYDPSYDDRVRSEEGDNLNVIVIDNGDGTNTMTVYDYPVKFVNEKGEIEDISLELTAAGGGAYKSKKSNIKTVFPQKAKDGIKLSHGEVNVKLTPKLDTQLTNTLLYSLADQSKGANSKKVTVEPDASSVNVTKLDKKRLSYYYNNSTRIEYRLTYTGFKEDIVVSEYTGQTEYVFTLETNGLTLCESNGSYYLTDKKGETKAHLGDIIITTADGANNTMGYITHKEIKKNKEYELTIHVDADWLADEKTAYPIRIDPTVGIRDEVPAVQDVTINSLAGSDADENQLYVGYREGYGVSRVLMKFPGLILADVLDSKKIISANVRLYNNSPSHAPIKAIAYMFTGNEWEEETVTWTNVNANSYTHFLSQNRINTTHMWYTFDILDYIKYCIDSPTTVGQGILFRAEDSVEAAGVTNYNRFASFNHLDPNKRPVITVEYDNSNSDNARPFGWFDTVTDTYASGWAWCVDAPDKACTVRVEMTNNSTGQVFVKECIANRPRPDVAQAGYDSGNYGFYCTLDWSECTPGQYTVRAIAIAPGGSRSDPNDCYELLSAKSYTVAGYAEVVPSGTFYLNNREYGRYLKNTNGAADAQSGLLANLGTSIQWILTEFSDGYVLQNLGDTNQMLAVPAGYTSDSVLLSAPDVLGTYNYVWDIVLASNGCFLKSRYNNRYLYIDGSGHLKTRVDAGDCFFDQSTGEVTDTTADACWRIVSIDEYGAGINYTYREYQDGFSFERVELALGMTKRIITPTISTDDDNQYLWYDSSDFWYTTSSNEIALESNKVTGVASGEARIKATHKVTGIGSGFYCDVREYIIEIINRYDAGFLLEYGNNNHNICKEVISESTDFLKNNLSNMFSIYFEFSTEYEESMLDTCKKECDVAVNELCAHKCECDPLCKNNTRIKNYTEGICLQSHSVSSKIISDFESKTKDCSKSRIYVLWTGHTSQTKLNMGTDENPIYQFDPNRSFEYNSRVYMCRDVDKYTYMHEICHVFGAIDHYHKAELEVECNNRFCIVCENEDSLPYANGERCIMHDISPATNPIVGNDRVWFCNGCNYDIRNGLNNSFE